MNSNASQACIKLGEATQALEYLNECTPSAKTSFKKGVVYGMTSEWKKALEALEEAEHAEGMEIVVKAERAKLMQRKKEAEAKERKAFSGLFK